MARLTITLSDERHRQLKMRAAMTGESIGQLIEEALCASEDRARQTILTTMEKAWAHADKVRANATDEEVMAEVLEIMRDPGGQDERTTQPSG